MNNEVQIGKKMSEQQHQIAVVKWANLSKIPLVHVANEGFRSAKTGAILKMMGMRPGFPDLFCPMPFGGYHGLFIEMKSDRNYSIHEKKSSHWIAQEQWIDELNNAGYYATMAFGWEDAMEKIKTYFKIK